MGPGSTLSCPTLGFASVLMLRSISPELVLFPDFWVSNIPRYFYFCIQQGPALYFDWYVAFESILFLILGVHKKCVFVVLSWSDFALIWSWYRITVVACQQGTLTVPDPWFCPLLWGLTYALLVDSIPQPAILFSTAVLRISFDNYTSFLGNALFNLIMCRKDSVSLFKISKSQICIRIIEGFYPKRVCAILLF